MIKLTMSHVKSLTSINDSLNTLESAVKQPLESESKNNEDCSNLVMVKTLEAYIDPIEEHAKKTTNSESKDNEDDGEIFLCGICCYCIWNCLTYCCQEHDE